MSGNTHEAHVGVAKSFEKTTALPDILEMFVAKKIYQGWLDASVTRELNSAASDFQCELVDVWETNKEPWRLTPGEAVHLHAGGKSLLTGYIDKTEASVSAGERRISCAGRSKTADLVDCSVMSEGDGAQFNGLDLKGIVEKVVSPFGIKTSFLGDVGAAFADVKFSAGETVFSLLDKLARQRKLVIYPSVEGTLVFSDVGIKRAATELVQGVNVKSGNVSWDHTNRFSIYKTKSDPNNLTFMGADAGGFKAPVAEATDAAVTRYRPLLIVNEVTGDDEVVENRAAYESSLRAAQALVAEVEVQGWFQAPGRLWDINEIIRCNIGFLGLKRNMLVKKVTFKKNNSGTTTTLSLILPDALDFTVKKKKKKDEENLSWLSTLDRKSDWGDSKGGSR